MGFNTYTIAIRFLGWSLTFFVGFEIPRLLNEMHAAMLLGSIISYNASIAACQLGLQWLLGQA